LPAVILGAVRDGDVVLTMGAGSVGGVAAAVASALPQGKG
jgi:UDP-N-acetylmuramate-alanine ligase